MSDGHDTTATSGDGGAFARLLVDAGAITEKQLRYAQRVRAKLIAPGPLLSVFEELGYIDREGLRAALQGARVEVPLGELLVELGHLGPEELEAALQIQRDQEEPTRLGRVLAEHEFCDEAILAEVLAWQLGLPYVVPDLEEIDEELLGRAPSHWYAQNEFIPVGRQGDSVVVAFADPTDGQALEAARTVFDENLTLAVARSGAIRECLTRLERSAQRTSAPEAGDGEIVRLVEELISDAIAQGASDIHIEPLRDHVRVRLRLDGALVGHKELPRSQAQAVVSRIKILCDADIAERRRHQGGRILFESTRGTIDLRVSFYVTIHGEKIVMRILNQGAQLLELEKIGMASRMLRRFVEDALERPSGIILITGPTGSGKTTTLYSCIDHINRPDVSILTAEDPVEYVIEGIGQCSINSRINLTFEETLRHMVRQDPDIIVIGEVRDRFSAETAIQAALTGHKVLTTFHTEDTIGGLVRLLNMEIEAFLISSTVVSVLAQRLLRRVCPDCAEARPPGADHLRRLGYGPGDVSAGEFRAGRGCAACRYTGYRGRIAVHELLVLNELVRDAILEQRPSYEIRRISTESTGLVTLMEDGIMKAARGQTTLDEVLRTLPCMGRPRAIPELRRLLGK